eukprot:3289505-Pleurochrysis_carterae.AAC.2
MKTARSEERLAQYDGRRARAPPSGRPKAGERLLLDRSATSVYAHETARAAITNNRVACMQLLQARELHGALRSRCAELERHLKRDEHAGEFANLEYLKNIIYKVTLSKAFSSLRSIWAPAVSVIVTRMRDSTKLQTSRA